MPPRSSDSMRRSAASLGHSLSRLCCLARRLRAAMILPIIPWRAQTIARVHGVYRQLCRNGGARPRPQSGRLQPCLPTRGVTAGSARSRAPAEGLHERVHLAGRRACRQRSMACSPPPEVLVLMAPSAIMRLIGSRLLACGHWVWPTSRLLSWHHGRRRRCGQRQRHRFILGHSERLAGVRQHRNISLRWQAETERARQVAGHRAPPFAYVGDFNAKPRLEEPQG